MFFSINLGEDGDGDNNGHDKYDAVNLDRERMEWRGWTTDTYLSTFDKGFVTI